MESTRKIKMVQTESSDKEKSQTKNFQKDGKKRKEKVNTKQQPGTVMFIPNTRRGTLLRMMRENEDSLAEMTGFRVSYSEPAGTNFSRVFSLDSAKNQLCGRSQEKCSCNSDKIETNCKAICITYKSRCTLCNPEKKSGGKDGGVHSRRSDT